MRRILLVLTAAALLATMVLATAVPAFADPEVQGHYTQDYDCGSSLSDPCYITQTSAGKTGNVDFGPGNFKNEVFTDPSALGTTDPVFGGSSSSSGHTADGGGRRTTEFALPGDFRNITFDQTCVGTDDGSGAPGC